MKVPAVTCGTDGRQPQAFVCVHIIESIREGEAAGFWWSRGPAGVWAAVCDQWNGLSQAEFDALGPDNIGVICRGCVEDAAALNGVEVNQ